MDSDETNQGAWKKTRFFQFLDKREMFGTWFGIVALGFFFPFLAIAWVVIGVLYYRVKNPPEHGGL